MIPQTSMQMSTMIDPAPSRPVRVLIVDDSVLIRHALTRMLSRDPDIVVVGAAADAYAARDKILELQPDVLTLDVEMPRMDGITFLQRLMVYRPTPVVVLSGITAAGTRAAVEAMAAGAVEVLEKPNLSASMSEIGPRLITAVKAAAVVRFEGGGGAANSPSACLCRRHGRTASASLFALGASTGGVSALTRVLAALPPDAPPTVVVQHMPERFTRSFAERLDGLCQMRVSEACDGELLRAGHVLIAPGGRHMRICRATTGYRASISDDACVSHQKPSVDVLFRSVAQSAGRHAIAALLTGMGEDGAAGLQQIREAGGRTIAQDKASCVVFGMPGAAIARGAAERVVPLDLVAPVLIEMGESAFASVAGVGDAGPGSTAPAKGKPRGNHGMKP